MLERGRPVLKDSYGRPNIRVEESKGMRLLYKDVRFEALLWLQQSALAGIQALLAHQPNRLLQVGSL